MIVVNKETNIVTAYSKIKIEYNEKGHIVCWNDDGITWFALGEPELYYIIWTDVYPPNLDHMFYYIDGQFIEIPNEGEPGFTP